MALSNPKFRAESAQEEKVFELKVSKTQFDHERHIASQPLYGPFRPVNKNFSYMSSLLQREMPAGLGTRGLADWETDSLRWMKPAVDTMDEDASQEQNQSRGREMSAGDPVVARREIAARMQRKKMQELPSVMKGLKALREERLALEISGRNVEQLSGANKDFRD
jgi:hypothetical protein